MIDATRRDARCSRWAAWPELGQSLAGRLSASQQLHQAALDALAAPYGLNPAPAAAARPGQPGRLRQRRVRVGGSGRRLAVLVLSERCRVECVACTPRASRRVDSLQTLRASAVVVVVVALRVRVLLGCYWHWRCTLALCALAGAGPDVPPPLPSSARRGAPDASARLRGLRGLRGLRYTTPGATDSERAREWAGGAGASSLTLLPFSAGQSITRRLVSLEYRRRVEAPTKQIQSRRLTQYNFWGPRHKIDSLFFVLLQIAEDI